MKYPTIDTRPVPGKASSGMNVRTTMAVEFAQTLLAAWLASGIEIDMKMLSRSAVRIADTLIAELNKESAP